MRQITFRGTFWNQQRSRIFTAGEEIVDPSGEVTFRISNGTMRVLESGSGRNKLFFTNQDSAGHSVGTGVLFVRFNNFLSRHVHFTVSGSDPASVTPLSVALNYTSNPNMLYFGTGIAENPASPGTYRGSRDLLIPVNRMAVANVAFLTDKSENNLEEFSYDMSLMLAATVGRVNRLLGAAIGR